MDRKKVLIIAYYFPPMGGSGVQRPAKFAKYLREFGWEPVVLAPEPGAYLSFDESLLDELKKNEIRIERVKVRSLFHAGRKTKKHVRPAKWKTKLLGWITSWFYLPDNKKSWISPAVDRALELHSEEAFDAVFATAPPYSNLIVANKIKEATGIPVVMDFRDDWLKSHWIHFPTKLHFRKMKKLESETLRSADSVTVVNERYKTSLGGRISGYSSAPVEIIPNGYDPENFEKTIESGNPDKFTILHSGRFYSVIQPDTLLKAAREAINENPALEKKLALQFQGGLSGRHWKLINNLGLSKMVTDFGYVEHQQAVQNLINADILFLTLGERPNIEDVTPGKLFEYMGTHKPVLAFIPDGASSALLKLYGAAKITGIHDVKAGSRSILELFEKWNNGNLPRADIKFSEQFSRKSIARQLASVLDRVCGRN